MLQIWEKSNIVTFVLMHRYFITSITPNKVLIVFWFQVQIPNRGGTDPRLSSQIQIGNPEAPWQHDGSAVGHRNYGPEYWWWFWKQQNGELWPVWWSMHVIRTAYSDSVCVWSLMTGSLKMRVPSVTKKSLTWIQNWWKKQWLLRFKHRRPEDA